MKIRALLVLAASALLLAVTSLTLRPAVAEAKEGDARIHLLHGIPDTDVDVIVDGKPVIEGFKFGDTNDLSSFAGQTLKGLKVNAAGTDTTAIDAGDTDLPASGNFTVIAHLDAEGKPKLSVFENDTSKIDAGKGRLTVRHTAAAPAVDIKANGDVALKDITNGAEGKADLDASKISATVVPTGADDPVVIGPADVEIVEGSSVIVYAVGSLDDENLSVLTETITEIHTTPNKVNTGTSPVDGSTPVAPWVLLAIIASVGAAGAFYLTRSRPVIADKN